MLIGFRHSTVRAKVSCVIVLLLKWGMQGVNGVKESSSVSKRVLRDISRDYTVKSKCS